MLTIIVLSSCGVKYKSVPYFTDLPPDSTIRQQINNQTVLKIQNGDILALTVSSLNIEASALFNLGNTSSVQGATTPNGNPSLTSNGFLVDQKGDIQLPMIGSLKIEGLSVEDARALIESKLMPFLKEPVVSLRLVNFRVSVLGDVAKPGVYQSNNEKLTVSEVLSLAGDLTITAVRQNILLVREENGQRQFIRLNLQTKDLFNSPYYYLRNNDVIYVQPGNAKYASVDSSYRNVSIVLSALSVIALIISRL